MASGRPRVISDERILLATRDAVRDEGMEVSTLEIARRAGVSEGTIFRRFPTKAALFRAALGLDDDELVAPFRALADSGSAAGAEAELVTAARAFVASRRRLRPLQVAHRDRRPRRGVARAPSPERDLARRCVLSFLRGARAAGAVEASDELLVAWSTTYVSLLWGLEVDESESIDGLIGVLLPGLRSPASAHPHRVGGQSQSMGVFAL